LFGTKKIYAKILKGNLVIRVGGGFMVIQEFIQTYADQEMAKIVAMQQRDEAESNEGSAPARSFSTRNRSPRAGSPKGSIKSGNK